MSYLGYQCRTANLAEYWAGFKIFMEAIGWTVHDAISANEIVYKSNGESGAQMTCYVWMKYDNYLYVRQYLSWNETTHTGITCQNSCNIQLYGNTDMMMCGDKNLVLLATSITTSSNSYSLIFGLWPYPVDPTLTMTIGDIVAGDAVSVPVVSSAGIVLGVSYQIVGVNGEGRDKLLVRAIPDATHILVKNVPRDYGSGAYFGRSPNLAGIAQSGYWYPLCHINGVGVAAESAYYYMTAIWTYAGGQTDLHVARKQLTPILCAPVSHGYMYARGGENRHLFSGGGSDDLFYLMATQEDAVKGDATSASNTTIVDSSKSWTVDALIGKFVVIILGTGKSQVRLITTNDETTITVDRAWTTNPDATSDYKVVDAVYRQTYYYGSWEITATLLPIA